MPAGPRRRPRRRRGEPARGRTRRPDSTQRRCRPRFDRFRLPAPFTAVLSPRRRSRKTPRRVRRPGSS
ncbi:hypothetical protein BRD17_00375 [Halobacteriales archaeon SW_7_68_16]|nr:MAG: hypothetical protein BRD17_00375 [Halobacteriales archaeon SW_7_68_16]